MRHTVAGTAQLNRRVSAANHANHNLVSHSVRGVGRASALRNNALASASTRRSAATRALSRTTFRGHLAGESWRLSHGNWSWRHRRPFIVIGWLGPLFWPYAYWDFIDYTFWPYGYDVFWPYAYDDLYEGLYGPYAYEGPAYSGAPASGRSARATAPTSTSVVVCGDRAPALTDWPIEQIVQTVEPNQEQQAALNDLKDATAQALQALQSSCPDDLPSTPTGRLAAMGKRTETMLQALNIVQPPMQRFYDSLSDEQKARFNAISPESSPTSSIGRRTRSARGSRPPDLAQVCSAKAAGAVDVPTDRIERILRPTDVQRAALNELKDAAMKAGDILMTRCPKEQTLTPPGHVAAMEQRLKAMLEAINAVEPALENFYGTLTDEQKARFNQLGSHQT